MIFFNHLVYKQAFIVLYPEVIVILYRQQQAKNTKQLIFRTAIALFQEHGFENVTVADIVKAAQVSRGCFYIYYKNKEDLLGDYIHQNDDVYLSYYQDVLCSEEYKRLDALTRAELFLWFSVETLAAAGPHLLHLYNIFLIRTPELYARRDRSFFTILKTLYDEAKADRSIRADISYESFQEITLWLIRGISIDWAGTNASFSLDAKRPILAEFIHCIRAGA